MRLKCTIVPKTPIFGILAVSIKTKTDVELSIAQAKRCLKQNAILSTIIGGESVKINMRNVDEIFTNAEKSSVSKVIGKDDGDSKEEVNNETSKPVIDEVKAEDKKEEPKPVIPANNETSVKQEEKKSEVKAEDKKEESKPAISANNETSVKQEEKKPDNKNNNKK